MKFPGATGTLYTYQSKNDVKQILKADSDFINTDKGIKHSIKARVYTDIYGDNNDLHDSILFLINNKNSSVHFCNCLIINCLNKSDF